MKAVKIKKNGGPEVLDLEEITLRKPLKDEVLIEHAAIGLNYIDTYHRSGLYPVELPSNIGIEGAGTIEKVGPDVKDFSIGDKVAYASMPIGSYSTHRIFPTKKLVKVPNEIELENVVTAPHIGSATAETRQKMVNLAYQNLVDALEDRTPRYLVNPQF